MKSFSNFLKNSPLVPRQLKHLAFRKLLRVEENLPPGLCFKIANTPEEIEAALLLLERNQSTQNTRHQNNDSLVLNKFQLLPTSTILIAKIEDKVVGTLTLVRRGQLGLPLEKSFSLAADLKKGEDSCEITGLAFEKSYRRQRGSDFLFPMFKFMFEYAQKYFEVSRLFVVCNPKDVDFYEGILLFKRLSKKPSIKDLNGTPATALLLDLPTFSNRLEKTYQRSENNQNLHRYFYGLSLPHFNFPARQFKKVSDANWTQETIEHLLKDKKFKIAALTIDEIQQMQNHYANTNLSKYFYSIFSKNVKRKFRRFDSSNYFRILNSESAHLSAQRMTEVSRKGLRFFSDLNFEGQKTYRFEIELGQSKLVQISAQLAWSSKEKEHAFTICEDSPAWNEYIDYLEGSVAKSSSRVA